MKRMRFLVNPPRATKRGRTMTTRRSRGATRRTPPKGFHTWKAYMASIRPGAKKKRPRRNPAGGSTMASKKMRKRRHAGTAAARRRTTHHRAHALVNAPRRRRYRRNPPAMLKGLPQFAMSAAIGAVMATGGKVVARKGRGLLKQQAGTVFGMAAEALIGLAGGLLLSRVNPGLGRDFALGGIQSPLETTIQRLNIPHVSDSLADDGYYLGDPYGVDVVREDGGLAGYVSGPAAGPFGQFGDEEEVRAGYMSA